MLVTVAEPGTSGVDMLLGELDHYTHKKQEIECVCAPCGIKLTVFRAKRLRPPLKPVD